jgi:hypothetical protein
VSEEDAARLTIKLPSGETVQLTFPVAPLASFEFIQLSAPKGTTCDWVIGPPDVLGVISIDVVEGSQPSVRL